MKCKLCKNSAVIDSPALCKKHFIDSFEKKVYSTIKKYNLLSKGKKIAVACSGGKDSTVILDLLNKKKYDVTAIAIDEGISGYRDSTLTFLKTFCKQNKIPLKVYAYEKSFGSSLDKMLLKTSKKPCTVCGIFRRYLLNKHAKGFDVIVTGHNLDDEAQSILMNLILNNHDLLARLGPTTGIVNDKKFTQRVKPLYLCKEKEVMIYCYLKNLHADFMECPNIVDSFRAEVRDFLNDYEDKHPGFKDDLVKRFLKILPRLKEKAGKEVKVSVCKLCKEPSGGEICGACLMKKELHLQKRLIRRRKTRIK